MNVTIPKTEPRRASDFSENGLSEREVLASREKHGNNLLSRRPQKSFLRQFFGNLSDYVGHRHAL